MQEKTKIGILGFGRIGKIFFKIFKKIEKNILVIEKKQKNFYKKILKLNQCQFIFICLPTKAIRQFLTENKEKFSSKTIFIVLSKGIEEKSYKLPFQVIKEILPKNQISVLGGALMAEEINLKQKTKIYLATENKKTYKEIKKLFKKTNFEINFFKNLKILSLIGVLKNIYTLFITLCDYLKINLNTKSHYIAQSYLEIKKIINNFIKNKNNYDEILLSDLIVTNFSFYSNNKKNAILFLKNKIKNQSESFYSLKTIINLTKKYKLNLPILKKIELIYLKNKNAKKIINY